MPKKRPKRHYKHPLPPLTSNPPVPQELLATDSSSKAKAVFDEEICIEAKVTINPHVSVGQIDIECLDSSVEPSSENINSSEEECTVIVSQLIRIRIPVHFSAEVDAEKNEVGCKKRNKQCDCC
ncbi:hypothetical protein M9R32_04720 [Paenisporosarcina quisquiliarum]|uniref:Uncharacterized protein n=1 Tax=Paenisporosarcina quisquiliarum TaxID=365346 RepID=A0A9X3LEC6_9BACL|nr:hypothetical protein [Paenisporosarcina quisquiliarum]MCZ8536483.1 hypothetical protein [Paenisporosarcina quisquiliarum]